MELAADEPVRVDGMADFIWGFDDASQANECASSLREVTNRSEIVVLRIMDDDANSSLTFKADGMYGIEGASAPRPLLEVFAINIPNSHPYRDTAARSRRRPAWIVLAVAHCGVSMS